MKSGVNEGDRRDERCSRTLRILERLDFGAWRRMMKSRILDESGGGNPIPKRIQRATLLTGVSKVPLDRIIDERENTKSSSLNHRNPKQRPSLKLRN